MQQAARASDYTAFLMIEDQGEPGKLVEYGATEGIFTNPNDQRTGGLHHRAVRLGGYHNGGDTVENEIRKNFHQQLDELYLDLLRMSNRCLEIIEETRAAFSALDEAAADRIISGDDEIDDYRELVEESGLS